MRWLESKDKLLNYYRSLAFLYFNVDNYFTC